MIPAPLIVGAASRQRPDHLAHARSPAVQTRSRSTSRRSACRSRSTGTASPTWSPSACSSCSRRCALAPALVRRNAAGPAATIEDLLFYGVHRRRDRRPPRLRAVLQARLLRRQSARDLRGLEGRHGVPRRPARRARRAGAVRLARAAGRSSRSPTSSRRACRLGLAAGRIGNFINGELWGRFRPIRACRGRWCSRSPARRCRGIRRSSTSSRSRACCCSSCSGSMRAEAARLGQVSGAFLVGYGVFRFIAEYFREPDSVPRPARARHEHGPVALRADGRRRRRRCGSGAGGARSAPPCPRAAR